MWQEKKISILFLSLIFSLSQVSLYSKEDSLPLDTKKILSKRYYKRIEEKYQPYLVDSEKYTSQIGKEIHLKYYKHLLGIAEDLANNKNLKIKEGSLGFYYDKNLPEQKKLFFGIDVVVDKVTESDFSDACLLIFKKNIYKIADTIKKNNFFENDKDISGFVLSFEWDKNDPQQKFIIWINKKDLFKFLAKKIIFNEIIERSALTDAKGKIITLKI